MKTYRYELEVTVCDDASFDDTADFVEEAIAQWGGEESGSWLRLFGSGDGTPKARITRGERVE